MGDRRLFITGSASPPRNRFRLWLYIALSELRSLLLRIRMRHALRLDEEGVRRAAATDSNIYLRDMQRIWTQHPWLTPLDLLPVTEAWEKGWEAQIPQYIKDVAANVYDNWKPRKGDAVLLDMYKYYTEQTTQISDYFASKMNVVESLNPLVENLMYICLRCKHPTKKADVPFICQHCGEDITSDFPTPWWEE